MSNVILCCGGRDFTNRDFIFECMDRVKLVRGDQPFAIVQGGARGADRLCFDWALSRGVPAFTCPAHWGTMGNAAGMTRNRWMHEYMQPFYGVAFPGGSGTRGMVEILTAASVPVWQPVP